MNTFHIRPTDALAAEAVEEVRALAAEGVEYAAIRGETWGGHDHVYTVTPAPEGSWAGYLWTYVSVSQWLAEYEVSKA